MTSPYTAVNEVRTAPKLTRAQREFLHRHKPGEVLSRWLQHKTYDFVGRMRDLGVIEIVDGKCSGWPYTWEGTRLTEAGCRAIASAESSS